MSKWIEHIKSWAKQNNKSFGCALSDKRCSEDYQRDKNRNTTPSFYKARYIEATTTPKKKKDN